MNQKKLFSDDLKNALPSPKIDKILNEIETIYQSKIKMDEFEICRKWDEIGNSFYNHKMTVGDIKRLIQFGIKLRDFKGTDRNRIERDFFTLLKSVLTPFFSRIEGGKHPFPIKREKIETIGEKEVIEKLLLFLEIEKFAIDSYKYKRDRDSFAGKRRAFSIELIGNFLNYFQSSQGLQLVVQSLKSKSKAEVESASEILNYYCRTRGVSKDEVLQMQ